MKIGVVAAHAGDAAAIRRILKNEAAYDVAWIAPTTGDALRMMVEDPVDTILLGIHAAAGESADAVRRIGNTGDAAILLLAESIEDQAAPIFDALGAGAIDVLNIVENGREVPDSAATLLAKLGMVARLRLGKAAKSSPARAGSASNGKAESVVLIGASAGGPAAIATVLSGLPPAFDAPVVIVQHIDAKFARGLADWLAQQCTRSVQIAQDQERLEKGHVYIAGRGEHLKFRDRHTLVYDTEPSTHAHKPSIDEMFLSAAAVWKADAIGVLLTGMGQDGAVGLRKLREAGAVTISQDQASSVVYGIPKAAARMNAAVHVLPLTRIAAQIAAAAGATGVGSPSSQA
jgi:two-component system response regulator WspF